MTELLLDGDPSVRLWAAADLLPLDEAMGVAALERLVAEAGLHGFEAELTLEEWRAGRLERS